MSLNENPSSAATRPLPPATERAAQRLDAVRAEMQQYGISGISTGPESDDQKVDAFGRRSAQPSRDSIFRAETISKLFNAVAIMQLVEQGKLDLDRADRTAMAGSSRWLVPLRRRPPPITLRHAPCATARV